MDSPYLGVYIIHICVSNGHLVKRAKGSDRIVFLFMSFWEIYFPVWSELSVVERGFKYYLKASVSSLTSNLYNCAIQRILYCSS